MIDQESLGCLPPRVDEDASAALGAGAALGGLAAGCRRARRTRRSTCGGGASRNCPACRPSSTARSKNYTAATVKPMLQDTAVVISQFQTAAAAGNAPDIQFLWNGIYHMESVWLGYLQPLEGLVSGRGHQGLEPDAAQPLRRQDLSRRLVPAADDLDLQQGPVRQGRPRSPTAPPADLGRVPRRLRQAQVRRHRAGRRRHPGRLLGRMVLRPCAGAERRQRRRGDRAVHRRARLPRSEVSRALGASSRS